MSDDESKNPEDEFREMLRELLSGNGSIDPSQLAGAAGLPNDPAALQALIGQLQNAMQAAPGGGINWQTATDQAMAIASEGSVATTPAERQALEQAFHVAALWLDEATVVSSLAQEPVLMTRAQWAKDTMPVWAEMAEPVATSISDALTRVMTEQAPEEMQPMIAGASQMMRNIGGALFAMQLGQVVGQLSREVVSGGDIGIPLLDENRAALVPQNVASFGEGLDLGDDQVQLYLAVRELAHARLFRHARWLRLDLISSITEFARGIRIDNERLEDLADGFDPSNPEELRQAMVDGSLIPPKSEAQLATLARLETRLALIEGWVDVVTVQATTRLPKADSVAEMVRRRRATGGPAESAFATLVGLELRPRRLREAAAFWQKVSDAVGIEARDGLWAHPDLVPTGSDIDDPAALIARLQAEERGETPEPDEFDTALEALLQREESGDDLDAAVDGAGGGTDASGETGRGADGSGNAGGSGGSGARDGDDSDGGSGHGRRDDPPLV